ncbi:MAG: hypothetical protein HAW67_01975 [Endozoicomonadaceae bacterium]|nr:hypothetical protein [Endozoicomonadaceae bacterium]
MKQYKLKGLSVIFLGIAILFAYNAMANEIDGFSDLSKLDPNVYTTIYEDKNIAIWEAKYVPGQKGERHSHGKEYSVYVVEGDSFKITAEDDSVRDLQLKLGGHFKSKAWKNHWGWNTDTKKNARFIIIQPK